MPRWQRWRPQQGFHDVLDEAFTGGTVVSDCFRFAILGFIVARKNLWWTARGSGPLRSPTPFARTGTTRRLQTAVQTPAVYHFWPDAVVPQSR
jgi:hypothetical protein